jgi:hypothetical protein
MKLFGSRMPRIIVALALAMGLAACSAIKLGYSTAPDLAYWWLDGYLDFTSTQAPQVKDALRRLHVWHRHEELPRVVELLERLEQLAPGPISAQQACGVVSEVQARMRAVADHAEPAVISVAASLTPGQLRHLERKYRRNNEAFTHDWLAPPAAERLDKRFKQVLERVETIYGSLDAPQRAVLRAGIAQAGYEPQRVLAERQRRQKDLLQTLHRVANPATRAEDARTLMRGYLERAQHSPDPAYRAWQEALVQQGCRIFANVHASTTAVQRQQAVQRLRAYARDLRELSGND